MTDREIMQQALEALEGIHPGNMTPMAEEYWNKTMALLRERLAQPEQEPVKVLHKHEWFRTGEMKVGQMRCISCGEWGQEETPQRKPLTDEQLEAMAEKYVTNCYFDTLKFARAIEAAHGIKENT